MKGIVSFFPPSNIILQTRPPELHPEAYKDTIHAVFFKHVCKNVLASRAPWGVGELGCTTVHVGRIRSATPPQEASLAARVNVWPPAGSS